MADKTFRERVDSLTWHGAMADPWVDDPELKVEVACLRSSAEEARVLARRILETI